MPNTDYKYDRLYRENQQRMKERAERDEAWRKKGLGKPQYRHDPRTGGLRWYGIDAQGKRRYPKVDDRGHPADYDDTDIGILVGLAIAIYLVAGLGLGRYFASTFDLTKAPALTAIGAIAAAMAILFTYLHVKRVKWIKERKNLALLLGAIAIFALIVSVGWKIGYDLRHPPAQSASSLGVDGNQLTAAVLALVLAIGLSAVLPSVGVPIAILLVIGIITMLF
jgi:hypothetical protein